MEKEKVLNAYTFNTLYVIISYFAVFVRAISKWECNILTLLCGFTVFFYYNIYAVEQFYVCLHSCQFMYPFLLDL